MRQKVYILLDLVGAEPGETAGRIAGIPGIKSAEVLEGCPDLLVVIDTPERQQAAQTLMGLLDLIDGITADVRVLPVRQEQSVRRPAPADALKEQELTAVA